MHIMEGFLPPEWCIVWFVISIPVLVYGIYKLTKITKKVPEAKPLLALMGAFIFVISALKLPSVVGSSSHPTGTGLAAVFFGPAVAGVLSLIVLVFQALLLAHGGLTTLGANVFSMGIAGPAVGFAIWMIFKRAKLSPSVGIFTSVALSDLVTYVVTSIQLALAYPSEGSVLAAFTKFAAIYAVTQIPIAIAEGIVAVLIFSFLAKHKGNILSLLKVIKSPVSNVDKEVN
ncbi:MAG: energy-coupling factor ABC transporter permease [Nitrososphaerota archaeon]|jgi:cobalt/nickel transport system permease protein|nr:energy-coupling factor ABC transporter permease [Nitrososphaerota archaeon]